jgi:DnaK suppressor protein
LIEEKKMARRKVVRGAKLVRAKPNKGAATSTKKKAAGRAVKVVHQKEPVGEKKVMSKRSTTSATPKRSEGFSKEELEHFRSIILEKRKQIIEELELINEALSDSSSGDYFEENSPYSLHMEQGTDTMEKEKNYLLAARQRKFLEYLDDAIKRIDRGVYGFCQDCGKLIDKARLEAVPHAQLCVSCKMKRGQ